MKTNISEQIELINDALKALSLTGDENYFQDDYRVKDDCGCMAFHLRNKIDFEKYTLGYRILVLGHKTHSYLMGGSHAIRSIAIANDWPITKIDLQGAIKRLNFIKQLIEKQP